MRRRRGLVAVMDPPGVTAMRRPKGPEHRAVRACVLIVSWACIGPYGGATRERCQNGHKWGPGRIILSWMPCDCPPAMADREKGPGQMVVHCHAAPGCQSAWYKPRHDPDYPVGG
jgi:hypothetical protein